MTLHLLSPLDGRYAETTVPLTDYFSELAFLSDSVRVELNLLLSLSKIDLVRPLSDSESAQIESIITNFSDADAELILENERKMRHDVKAIEYFLQEKLKDSSLQDLLPWIHFCLTSEDTNSIRQAIDLTESRDKIILPALNSLTTNLSDFAFPYKPCPILLRT